MDWITCSDASAAAPEQETWLDSVPRLPLDDAIALEALRLRRSDPGQPHPYQL